MKRWVAAAGYIILLLLVAGCTSTRISPVTPGPAPDLTASAAPVLPIPVTPAPATMEIPVIPAGSASGQAAAALSPSAADDRNLSSYILMDNTRLVTGEVAVFHIVNHGPGDLRCRTTNPSYEVFVRFANDTWNTDPVTSVSDSRTDPLVLDVGDSTGQYRFVTTGWSPGEYQLVVNCFADGRPIHHGFFVREKPAVLVFN